MRLNLNVLFFGIILNIIYFITFVVSFSNLINENTVGTNIVEKPIEFTLLVEDSLYVAKGTELDFGIIPKGSTGTFISESNIEVSGGIEGSRIKAVFNGGEVEEGYRKFKIFHENSVEEEEENINLLEEIKELDIYLKEFENEYIMEEKENGELKTLIPIIGELRGVKNAKLGKYEAKINVEIILVSIN